MSEPQFVSFTSVDHSIHRTGTHNHSSNELTADGERPAAVHEGVSMRYVFAIIALLSLAVGVLAQEAKPAQKPLYTYDLTYTLKLDRSDPKACRRIWDENHFVSSVQGIANSKSPVLYLFFVGGEDGKTDRFWLDKLRAHGEWLADRKLVAVPELTALVKQFHNRIRGLVVYDEKVPSTSNVASTIAGVESLACVRFDPAPDSLYTWLTSDPKGPKLPVKQWLVNRDGTSMFTGKGMLPGSQTRSTGSAKCDAYIWAKERYLDTGKCNAAKLAYYIDAYWISHPGGYIPNHTLSNHDYFIANKAFFFDLSPWEDETPVDDRSQPLGTDHNTLKAILRSAYDQLKGKSMIQAGGFLPWDKKYTTSEGAGKHDGVPGEWHYAEILSCYNAYMDADALGYSSMANASVYQHYPLKPVYKQKLPTVADLKAKGFILADGKVAAKSFVSIYVGDYDAAAWLYNAMPQNWEDPARGTIPLGWAFNPNLAQRFAAGMDYVRKTATPNDYFVAGDSGAGYINPGNLAEPRKWSGLPSGVKTWTEHCLKWYKQFDLSLTGFVIDGYAPEMSKEVWDAYATFSPSGIVGQKVDPLGVYKGMPFLRMTSDLGSAESSANLIRMSAGGQHPEFFMYRDILWSPSSQKKMMDLVKDSPDGKDVEFVDPYTLMLLVKQFKETGQKVEVGNVDLWDVRAGSRVTGNSGVIPGFDIRDMFGGSFGSVERGPAIFQEKKTEPFTHWVEWRTTNAVKIGSYKLYAHGDNPSSMMREFKQFRLFAKESKDGQWAKIDEFTPTHPYQYEAGYPVNLLHTGKLAQSIATRYFRAEFDQYDPDGNPGAGPRILELDGFGPEQ